MEEETEVTGAEETRVVTEEAEIESDTDPEAENVREIELEEETEEEVLVTEVIVPDADHGVAREVTVATIVAVVVVVIARIERAKIGPTDPLETPNNSPKNRCNSDVLVCWSGLH